MPTPKKSYCFTLNNYTEEEYASIIRNLSVEGLYSIVGREVGSSGTPHLQGYVIFKRAYHFNTIKNRYLPRCHIEVAAGSAASNRAYCSKDGDFIESGSVPQQRKGRLELAQSFVQAMDRGRCGMVDWANEEPGTWYFSGHNLLRNYYAVQRTIERPNIRVQWICGPPGVGKSRRAHEELPEAFVKEPRTKWWSGYALEKEVIIDDFGPNGIDINHLLRWFDRYKCYVESKGGMLPLHADTFIVTSNFSPRECFQDSPQIEALERRLNVINMFE